MTAFRLTLDVPYSFAREPGYSKAQHCADFRPQKESHSNTWRCPLTGLVMLEPSFYRRDYVDGFRGLDQWRHEGQFFTRVLRGVNLSSEDSLGAAEFITYIRPANASPSQIQIMEARAIVTIQNLVLGADTLYWALQSKWSLEPDEAFVLHYHAMTDEVARKHNWFMVAWDAIGLHFSQTGMVRAYLYDRDNLATPPVLFEEFEIAAPGELMNRPGYFYLQSIPGIGLAIYHSRVSQRVGGQVSNAFSGVTRGHIIPWVSRTVDGKARNFERSPITLGLNPNMGHVMGVQTVFFPASGTYTDDIFEPRFNPSTGPSAVQAIVLKTEKQTITAALRKVDDSGAWVAGTDRQGRVRCTLSTDDTRYSPFLQGYGVQWAPVFATRNTTALLLDRFAAGKNDRASRMEWTDDERGSFVGQADLHLETAAARLIAERGDCTFLLERSDNDGGSWATVQGGIGRLDESEVTFVSDQTGCYYNAPLKIADMRRRLAGEVLQHDEHAFNSVLISDAFNVVLQSNGFAPIATADFPPEMINAMLPPPMKKGQAWSMAPGPGDTGEEVLDKLLFFLTAQNSEFRYRHDWDAEEWIAEPKPRDTSIDATWTLTDTATERNIGNRVVDFESFVFTPYPPEFNQLLIEGITGHDSNASRVPIVPIQNIPSFDDPANPDYLGRVITRRYSFKELSEESRLIRAGRVVFAAAGHRQVKAVATLRRYPSALTPATQVYVRYPNAAGVRGTRFTMWVKRRTVVVSEKESHADVTLTLSTQWESEVTR